MVSSLTCKGKKTGGKLEKVIRKHWFFKEKTWSFDDQSRFLCHDFFSGKVGTHFPYP